MLTIGELASYAGVTVRAVRHYHAVGLLPEPGRDSSGYRAYDAAAVVALIRIRTLAEAGVPLARVRELLDADGDTFSAALTDIDQQLTAKIDLWQEHRRRIAELRDGDALALPLQVVDYLDQLRAIGASDAVIGPERDAWILMAARYPHLIASLMADKVAQLDDPKVVAFYRIAAKIADLATPDADHDDRHHDGQDDGQGEDLVREAADLLVGLLEQAADTGQLDGHRDLLPDDRFVRLLDSFADAQHPAIGRLRQMLAERGWIGWTRIQRRPGTPPER
jgi:DNA-binding transcriptional MerR regulator